MSEKPALALGAGSQTSTGVAAKTRTMLWVLLIVYILNFLDRQIVNILAEPIARDLKLSDSDIGLMTGLAFALFYTFLGLPIARYADRPSTNRVGLISVSLAIWSGMTVLCGMAQNFVQLLLARIGVGASDRSWLLELWGLNIFNKYYTQVGFDAPLQNLSPLPNNPVNSFNAFPGAPATYGITFRKRF